MKKLLVAAAVAGLVGTANAQSAFEGAFGQIGIGYQSAKPTISGVNFNSTNGFATTVGAGYNFAIDKSFLLGIGAEYSPVASSSANYTAETTGKYKNQNTYNIFLTPGVAISKDSLAYAKVGYTGTTIRFEDNGGSNKNLTGYSLGLGYKQVIDGGLYGFAEGNYFSYSNKTFNDSDGSFQMKANSYNLLVGVGYKF